MTFIVLDRLTCACEGVFATLAEARSYAHLALALGWVRIIAVTN